jgi:1,4-dihydroxy-2-naphthoate octaprenyltransferase
MSTDRPSALRIWLSATRPRTLPAAIAPVLAASALAWHDGNFQPWAAATCAVFALLIQIGTNFANDYYDFVKGADTAERVGPRRAVAAGWVRPSVMQAMMAVVFALAFAVGLSLLRFGGWPLLVIGVSSIVCGIAYTGGPYPLGYNGLGDLFVFVFFGLVAVGASYFVQVGNLTHEALLIATGIGFLATNILVVNNYRDVETDARAGKRTLVVRFGRGFARGQFNLSLVVALLVPIALVALGFKFWVLLALAIAPLAWRHSQRLRHARTASELICLLGDTGKLLALYSILLGLGLVLSR